MRNIRISYITLLYHMIFCGRWKQSNSVGGRTGWQPQHVLAKPPSGELVAAAPCYLKSHSRGEYVFDRGWAEAYERAGGSYYPKLQIAVPFTPATGPRLLLRPGPRFRRHRPRGRRADWSNCAELSGASGVHVTFATEPEFRLLGELGYLQRTDQQFHWENAGFASFDDFLAALTARKRKTIRRERQDALQNGITVHWLTGSDLTEDVWDAFFEFYMETGSRKWGRPYLTRSFYSLIGEKMRDRIVLVMAKRAGRWIAGAINFIGSHTLFGRHWGAIEHHPFLHFELCYYQAIDYAIAHKLLARRGRRAGRAQDFARLHADDDLFGALYRRSGVAPRHCRLPGARTRLYRGGGRRTCNAGAVPQGFCRRAGIAGV